MKKIKLNLVFRFNLAWGDLRSEKNKKRRWLPVIISLAMLVARVIKSVAIR